MCHLPDTTAPLPLHSGISLPPPPLRGEKKQKKKQNRGLFGERAPSGQLWKLTQALVCLPSQACLRSYGSCVTICVSRQRIIISTGALHPRNSLLCTKRETLPLHLCMRSCGQDDEVPQQMELESHAALAIRGRTAE